MPESQPDGPLPDEPATDEASPDYAAIAAYTEIIPRRAVMTGWLED